MQLSAGRIAKEIVKRENSLNLTFINTITEQKIDKHGIHEHPLLSKISDPFGKYLLHISSDVIVTFNEPH